MLSDPLPVVVGPEIALLVTTGLDELQKIAVRHIAAIDREAWYVNAGRAKLVVPPERNLAASSAELHRPCWNLDLALLRRGPIGRHAMICRPTFLIEGQSVPHVEQRLLVHGLVFEDREDRIRAIEERMTGNVDIGMCQRVQHQRVGGLDERSHARPVRPGEWRATTRGLIRIDASGKQSLQ